MFFFFLIKKIYKVLTFLFLYVIIIVARMETHIVKKAMINEQHLKRSVIFLRLVKNN